MQLPVNPPRNPTITLRIPFPTPSPNLTRWRHWRAVKKERDEWRTLVSVAILQLPRKPGPCVGSREVAITRIGKRLLDPDNLVGSVKVVLDALRDFGLISDDSTTSITLKVSQKKTEKGEKPYTLINITEVLDEEPNVDLGIA